MIWGAPRSLTRPHSAPSLLLCHTPQDQRPHIADQCSLNHERQPGIVNAVETIRDVRKAEPGTQNQSVCTTAATAASLNKRFNPTCVRRWVCGNSDVVNSHTRGLTMALNGHHSQFHTMMRYLKHLVIGFVAGYLVAAFILVFLGVLQPHNDLNQPERDQQAYALMLVFCLACVAGVFAMVFATTRISQFWLLFMIVFGVMSVIPFWPLKNGSLLPLGTPYVNFGYRSADSILLLVHVIIAMAIAAIIHWVLPLLRRHESAI
jgi:hypothetical protein